MAGVPLPDDRHTETPVAALGAALPLASPALPRRTAVPERPPPRCVSSAVPCLCFWGRWLPRVQQLRAVPDVYQNGNTAKAGWCCSG